jgi:hypothetical protein
MPSWITLQHEFLQLLASKDVTVPALLGWIAENFDRFPEGRRGSLLFWIRYRGEQTFELLHPDQQFGENGV